ncbi:hypothetical protein EJB05_49457 [Eragrostis curvula]|uniref:non-specific serine/threonine protein kinase n=1 Tax=Eragrostis curvula TaxID=38414 RepID=A0A5J9T4F6_9POAL|nr:hypothetical protein EJB05_49457 [Eragrostis curvula]
MDMNEHWSHHHASTTENLEFDYLRTITENFSETRIIGSGGFGTVYKGEKDNGEFVAVKKLNDRTRVAIDDRPFLYEVKHMMDISHPNIVRLEGYCYHVDRKLISHNGNDVFADIEYRMLCFEYLPNGSLEGYLKDKSRIPDWNERYKIIMGICEGLLYLHEDRHILHLDLKPANVLLDEDMIPKIADFGQSRLCLDEGNTHTINIAGTIGYMAPEYVESGKLTKEVDVYSLGIIIMQIVAGEMKYPRNDPLQLSEVIRGIWKGRLETTSRGTEEYKQVEKCIDVALKCMQVKAEERPNIKQIIENMKPHPESCVIPIDPRPPAVMYRRPTPPDRYIPIQRPDVISRRRGRPTWRGNCKISRIRMCTIAIAIILAIPVAVLGFLRDLSITVEDASLTKFSLTTSPAPMLDYNISVTLRIYNPNWVMSIKSTGPLEAVYSLDGKRFDRVQVVEADNPNWVVMSTKKTEPFETIYSFDGGHFDGMELVEADNLPAQRSRIYSIQLFPDNRSVALGSAGMSNYMKQKKRGVFEVSVALVGQVTSTGRLTKCKLVATCPLKLHLAPPVGMTAPPFPKVKCSLANGCSKCGCKGVRAFPWRSGLFVRR